MQFIAEKKIRGNVTEEDKVVLMTRIKADLTTYSLKKWHVCSRVKRTENRKNRFSQIQQ